MRENYGTCGGCASRQQPVPTTILRRNAPQGTFPREHDTLPHSAEKHTKELRFPMLNLSPSARKELEAYFADKDRQTIRIFLAPGG